MNNPSASNPSNKLSIANRFRGCLLGLAVGDALGASVEFQSRGTFKPISDMIGGGPFSLAPGQWTDDTSMALCLANSLLERNGFDATDQMNKYREWFLNGYMSSTGRCFDIGLTTRAAIHAFMETGNPNCGSTDPKTAGNGSIMRLAPVVLYFYPNIDAIRKFAVESSRTTHAADECLEACSLMSEILHRALSGATKDEVLQTESKQFNCRAIKSIANQDYIHKHEADIVSSGYVIKTLEASLWCFAKTESLEEAILRAVNLGDDSDTVAAVCGQIVGAYYGYDNIPTRWTSHLHNKDYIIQIADLLLH